MSEPIIGTVIHEALVSGRSIVCVPVKPSGLYLLPIRHARLADLPEGSLGEAGIAIGLCQAAHELARSDGFTTL